MPGPFITDEQIARAREMAQEITDPIFDLIRRHTTVSTERTVLRFLGISGAGPGGVPLVNLMVDKLHGAGVLNRGAAYWYGRALKLGARSPLEAVERLTALPKEALGPLPPEQEQSLRAETAAEARGAVEELKSRIARRDALRDEL
ncbi:MAG TPA: lysine 5,6-aminomutase subunit alpha, partial [Myxococcales bacterium]|nr:lysine 5,6-aminomutase subunit alpha [Myxococcales bacterium]